MFHFKNSADEMGRKSIHFDKYNGLMPARAVAALGAALISLALICSTSAAEADQKCTDLTKLYASVADAVVSISAQVTHPASSNLNAANASQGSDLQQMLGPHFRDQPKPNQPKSSDDTGALGSGFVIDSSGTIVTAQHVIGLADDIEVIFSDGHILKAKLVGSDREVDIAVLQVTSPNPLKTVKFGNSDAVLVGEPVMAVGNPFGIGQTVTSGIISALRRNLPGKRYDSFLQTDAAINRGNSGGPLFNMAGEVIGINTAIFSPSGDSIGLGFATPAATAIPVISQLESFHETRRGWLGVDLQNLTEPLAESLGIKTTHGALISKLYENSPGDSAGLRIGDVVVSLSGSSVTDAQDMRTQLEPMPEGKNLDVSILRDAQPLTIKVVLGRKPNEDGAMPAATGDADPGMDKEVSRFEGLYGLKLSTMSEGARAYFQIKEGIDGVVVFGVIADSSGAKAGFQIGDIIEQVSNIPVSLPSQVRSGIEALREEKKPYALIFASNPAGETRFVALPVAPE
jgi:serine protease Do